MKAIIGRKNLRDEVSSWMQTVLWIQTSVREDVMLCRVGRASSSTLLVPWTVWVDRLCRQAYGQGISKGIERQDLSEERILWNDFMFFFPEKEISTHLR